MRFVCTDPDAGDLEFPDAESVLDALEAALVQPATPLFDGARQSWQPLGLHPEIRAAWEHRLRYRPTASGLRLPDLPTVTALVRSLPDSADEREQRREAYARARGPRVGALPPLGRGAPAERPRRLATIGLVSALLLLALVGWALVTFAARLTDFAAGAVGLRSR
jgi:hypothetical protein